MRNVQHRFFCNMSLKNIGFRFLKSPRLAQKLRSGFFLRQR